MPLQKKRELISQSIQQYMFSVLAFFWKNCKSVQINCCLFGELVYFVASKNSLQYFLWMIWSRNLQQEKEECIFSWSCATYEVAVETTIISTKTVTVELTYFYKNWNGNHCRAMLPSVVRYYHTGHPRKKILFEPKSIGCIDKSMHILQQKCIFSWPTIFFTTIWQKQQQSFLRMMESYLLTGWMDEKETWSISILLQKMFFLCPTILFADDGTEPERPSHHHNRPLHYSVVRCFFTLKIQLLSGEIFSP